MWSFSVRARRVWRRVLVVAAVAVLAAASLGLAVQPPVSNRVVLKFPQEMQVDGAHAGKGMWIVRDLPEWMPMRVCEDPDRPGKAVLAVERGFYASGGYVSVLAYYEWEGEYFSYEYAGGRVVSGDTRFPVSSLYSFSDLPEQLLVLNCGGTGLLQGVEQVTANELHSLALLSDGRVVAWGYNYGGRLGDGGMLPWRVAVPVLGPEGSGQEWLRDVVQVAAGACHSLALLSNGHVVAWGSNDYGQLGDGTRYDRTTPVYVKGVGGQGLLGDGVRVIGVAAGEGHSLALLENGTVVAWGWNWYGQVGDGTKTDRLTPVSVPGLANVRQIAAGDYHSLVCLSNGTVKAWGWNNCGQLGDGTRTDRTTPVSVKGLSGAAELTGAQQVAAGSQHSLALLEGGAVAAWGSNFYGQLGDGTRTDRLQPVSVLNLGRDFARPVQQVVAGLTHSLARLSDGRVMAWGAGGSGQLGDGATEDRCVPVSVKDSSGNDLAGVVWVGAGSGHSLAVVLDGRVLAWGLNHDGVLGNGAADDDYCSTHPVEVLRVLR